MLKIIIINKIIYLEKLKKQATSLLLIRRIEDKINVLVEVLKQYEEEKKEIERLKN